MYYLLQAIHGFLNNFYIVSIQMSMISYQICINNLLQNVVAGYLNTCILSTIVLNSRDR